MYCKHGIAMRVGNDEAICTEFDYMEWNGAKLPPEKGFECNPAKLDKITKKQIPCKLYFKNSSGTAVAK